MGNRIQRAPFSSFHPERWTALGKQKKEKRLFIGPAAIVYRIEWLGLLSHLLLMYESQSNGAGKKKQLARQLLPPPSEKKNNVFHDIIVPLLSPGQVGWLRADDQTILSLHRRVVTHNPRVSVTHDESRTWNLHIRQVKESDQGCYMCQVRSGPSFILLIQWPAVNQWNRLDQHGHDEETAGMCPGPGAAGHCRRAQHVRRHRQRRRQCDAHLHGDGQTGAQDRLASRGRAQDSRLLQAGRSRRKGDHPNVQRQDGR